MPQSNPLAFRINFNGAQLVADPRDTESLYDAMARTIEQHAGSLVAQWGRCKKAGEHYRYPVLLTNGVRGNVFIEGNA